MFPNKPFAEMTANEQIDHVVKLIHAEPLTPMGNPGYILVDLYDLKEYTRKYLEMNYGFNFHDVRIVDGKQRVYWRVSCTFSQKAAEMREFAERKLHEERAPIENSIPEDPRDYCLVDFLALSDANREYFMQNYNCQFHDVRFHDGKRENYWRVSRYLS